MEVTTIPLPLICLTCLPPWPQAMMYAGKNLENRDASVAACLAPFVGQDIGISQSKGFPPYYQKWDANLDAADIEERRGLAAGTLGTPKLWPLTAGKLLLVARLDRIAKPSEYGRNPWHVRGQHGLILSNIRQIEPVPCTGGAGAWEPNWCGKCGHVYADNSRMPGRCYSCKAIFPENRMTRKGMEHLVGNRRAAIERPLLNVGKIVIGDPLK